MLPTIECRLEHPLRLTSIAARCGTLRVPLDREHPKEGSIDLKVAVVPALNRRSTAPPLFLLAGGPGQSAMQVYVALSSAFARINRNHAVVLLDQRGTGNLQSTVVRLSRGLAGACGSDAGAAQGDGWTASPSSGPTVRFYTTSIAVRDLDEVRAALGFDQIDLYGGSYGTRVAELYMRRYPAHVHAVILDGVTYPQQAIGAETPQDAERALNLIVARCLQAPDCAATYPQLQDELKALLRQFGPQKVMVTIDDPNSGLPLEIEFNRRILNAALRLLSYSSMQASLLPALIHEAAHGKLRPLAAQSVMNMRQISRSAGERHAVQRDLQRG